MKSVSRPGSRLMVVGLAGAVLLVAAVSSSFTLGASPAENRLLEDIRYLAADELEGRGIGTKGLDKASEFVRDAFQKAGLKEPGKGWYQPFAMISGSELSTPNALAIVSADSKVTELKIDSDFRTMSFGGSGTFEAEVVFCGYGIDSAEKKYQEFEGLDLKGKVALIIRRAPQQSNPHGPFSALHGDVSREGSILSKVSNAQTRGAAAILFVNDPHSIRKSAEEDRTLVAKSRDAVVAAAEDWAKVDRSNAEQLAEAKKKLADAVARMHSTKTDAKKADPDPLLAFGYGGRGKEGAVPVMQISIAQCNKLLGQSLHTTLEALESKIDEELKPQSAALPGVKVRGATSIKINRSEVRNVVGVLEGEGPLADETIVIGAHYDHLGLGGENSLSPGSKEIHNGADDNASGTVALLELARRFGERSAKGKLARRVVFIAFTGEESGLFGSAHYVKEPFFPIDKTVAMFNLDMVGRLTDDKLTVFGTGTSGRWKSLLEEQAKARSFKLFSKPEGFGPSDQSSFYAQKIPVLHFFTGTHSDYHRPSDDWEKINVSGMERVTDLIEEMVVATITNPERPDYVEVKQPAAQARTGSRPYFGSIPDFANEVSGYAISGVSPQSPAALGGLLAGDVIIELGGRKVTGLDDFDLALRNFAAGDEVTVVVQRAEKKVSLKVTLGKPR
ncbi:MAG: M28 family peptidase [Planctomycetaceae bacterium]